MVCSSFAVFDDSLIEEDETIAVMATFQQSAPEISLISNTAIITITDNDCKDFQQVKVLYPWHVCTARGTVLCFYLYMSVCLSACLSVIYHYWYCSL